jgi:hypothetical protein
MTSSSFVGAFGGRLGSSGTCGMLERPLGANVLLLDVSFALERASASLEGAFTLFSAQVGF